MVLSEVPSVSAPFVIRDPLHPALHLAFSDSCTRAKDGPEQLGAGGSDPMKFWAAESPQKRGRSRPFWCFFHGDFRLHRFSISYVSKKLLASRAEELAEDEAEECSPYTLQLFSTGSCSGTAKRQGTSASKWTVACRLLPPNSRQMSDSLTRATFHPR